MKRALTLGLLAATLALGACGKKAEPLPPSGQDIQYPRKYPTQ